MSRIAGVWNLDRHELERPLGGGRPLTFDGRLDNRDELLGQLHRCALSPSSSDSALILEAFRRWGAECFCRLNGEFALAIFDSLRRQLILARDPVGCRPLYYWTNGKTFVFGSEIKTVLAHPDVPSRPNKDLIADYFVRDRLSYEDFGETFFQDIHVVLPGRRLTVAAGSLTSTQFWDFDPESVVRFPSYSDYAERLRELLFQAVRRRLRTVHPVAVAVSGGLDSSIVLCIADQLRKDGATTASLLPISLTASEDGTTAENPSLALLESTTHLRIERLPFGAPADPTDLETAAWHSEWPRFDDGWCAQRPMFTWAHANGARTLLSGHWSDQLSFVTGYLSDLFTIFKWRDIAGHLDEYTRWFVDADPGYFRSRFRRELLFNLTAPGFRAWLRPFVWTARIGNRAHLITADLAARIERRRLGIARPPCRSAHARDIYQAVRSKAHRLQFEADGKLAASCGIEWTLPFLDRDLIAYLMSVPGEIQNHGGIPRALLRDAMRGIVPDVILQRRWRNEDETVRARELEYLSTNPRLDAAHTLGFLQQPFRVERETLDFLGLEFWSRAFFSDRLTALQQPSRGAGEPMDKADPTPRNEDEREREKLPYSPPTLTVHGDLRTITAAKQSDRTEAGQPKTFNTGMP